jgi:hypothetical protein
MDQQVSDRQLEEISRSCCEDWRSLPSYLQLETIVVKDIDRSQKVEEEKRHDFLKKWKKTQGSGATYRKLHDALLAIKSQDDAEKVCKIVQVQEVSSTDESHHESDSTLAMPSTNSTREFTREDALNTKASAPSASISTEPVGEAMPADPLTTKPGTTPATDESPPTNIAGMIRERGVYNIYYRNYPCLSSGTGTYNAANSIDSLDPDTKADLRRQLNRELRNINMLYTIYVNCIRRSLKEKGVDPKDLCCDLMNFPAFNRSDQSLSLVSAHEAELEKAGDINKIFSILSREYASFLNYHIFDFILTQYQVDMGQDELKYPEHLTAYLKRHYVLEFVNINPLLKKYSASKELFLKIDLASTSKLAKVIELRDAIAEILEVRSAAMRLLDIKDGCVVATFLIPTPVAKRVFNKYPFLTKEQQKALSELPILHIECNDYFFDFTAKDSDQSEDM